MHTLTSEVTITASAPSDPPSTSARVAIPAWVLDLLLGIPVALGALAPDSVRGVAPEAWQWPILALGLAVAVSLPLARRHPLPMLIATTLVAAIVPLWSNATVGFVLAVAICMYRLVSLTSRRAVAVVSFLVSAAVLVTSAAVSGPDDRYLAWVLQPIAFLLGAAALGEATRSRRAYVDAITERAERAERTRELEAQRRVTQERLRIARDLHDAAGHQMAAINLNAGVAKNALPDDPERATALLSSIQYSARTVLDEIGALLHLLRGAPDDGDALAPVATWANVPLAVEAFRATGLDVSADLCDRVPGLTGASDVVAYKVLQEGLANALKHGDGRAMATAEVVDAELALRVENLVGPEPATPPSGRYGLVGIRERVESVGGTVSARRETRRDGTAFVLAVRIPLGREER